MITKENIKELKQGDRIEALLKVILIQGNDLHRSIVTGCLIILTTIMAIFSPLIAFILWIFCIIKVIKDKKRVNNELKELTNEYFEIKVRSKK